jgi:hypothetical protein
MNPLFTLLAAAFAILLTIFVIASTPKTCATSEGFDIIVENTVLMCPYNTTTFMNSKDTTVCCDGTVTGKRCAGKVVCAISTNKENIPLCNDYLKDLYIKEGKDKCPLSMPNYYFKTDPGTGNNKNEFCTDSTLNNSLTGPISTEAKTCAFNNYEFDIRNPHSCIVQKMYDAAMCPHGTCQKRAINLQPNKAVVIQINYIDKEGNPRSCMEDTSLKNYYNDIKKPLVANNINLCSISKQVYIDNSMPVSQTSN